MAFSINTNIASLQAQEYLRVGTDFQSKTINRVTSGLRIINSGDDAAGLAIANSFRSDRAVLTQGVRNANDGLSTLQTIDGGINNISMLLDRARTLAAQSASGSFDDDKRALLDSEFSSVITEIDRQAQAIGLNSNGEYAKTLSVFIGGGKGTSDAAVITNGSASVDLSKSAVDSKGLGLSAYRAKGTADLSGTGTSTALGAATTIDFQFMGSGFGETDADVIDVTVNVNGVESAQSLADAINAAIEGYAATSVYGERFKNAGITASISSDGKYLQFDSSVTAFQVIGDSVQADAVIGAADDRIYSSGVQYTTVSFTDLTAGTEQNLSFSVRDAGGELQTLTVALNGGGSTLTAAEAVQAINAALYSSNIPGLQSIVAVADEDTGVNVRFMSTAPDFSVTVSVPDDAGTTGFNGGAFVKNDSQADTANAASLSIATAALAESAVTALGKAVEALGSAQAAVGKGQNTFNYAVSLAQTQLNNLAAAESRIRDADLAAEAANLTKAQVLQQAGIAALAQANAAPQAVLSLLRG
jgi:flagellin